MNFDIVYEHIKNNDLESLKQYIEKTINVIASEEYKKEILNKLLYEAAIRNNVRVIKYLISIGADVNTRDNAAIRWAAANGSLDAVKYLMTLDGTDISSLNHYAIRNAIENNYIKVVKYILSVSDDDVYNKIVKVVLDLFKYNNSNYELLLYLASNQKVINAILNNIKFHELPRCFILFLIAKFNVSSIDELKKVIAVI